MATQKLNLWGIILAGGAGKRLLEFTQRLYGYPRPKQYCVITGSRSMLERTLDRARMLITRDRLLTVILQSHRKYLEDIPHDQPGDSFVVQPECRDTGPGLLLALLKVHHADPKSVVTVFPSDHFIQGEARFMKFVKRAADFVEIYPEFIVLIGVKSHRPEVEYGWIQPGKEIIPFLGEVFSPIQRFWEKPRYETAVELHSRGCLWNTLVLIGRTSTFLQHIQTHLPDVFASFHTIREAFGTSREGDAIKTAYLSVPSENFTRSVLEKVFEHLYVLEAAGIHWSDWGNEDRIKLDIGQFKLRLTGRPADPLQSTGGLRCNF